MSAIDLLELLRGRPFVPFRIHSSDGRTFEVPHPDQALVLATRVILPIPGDRDVPQRSQHLALSHIVRVEELRAPATTSSN